MIRIKNFFIFIIAVLTLPSCDNESDILQNETTVPDAIHSIINDFRTGINVSSRSNTDFQVVSIDTKYYKIDSDTIIEIPQTRSDDSIFDISTVNIRVNDTDGFVVLSSDERLNKIFYYTENGHLSDTVNIPPLKEYINMVPSFAADEIIGLTPSSETRAALPQNLLIAPIVPFKWGQGQPFNDLAPTCGCKECAKIGGHRPIGCVPTAAAQTLATIGTFKPTHYGCRDIDFKTLPKLSSSMTLRQKLQVAHFFYEVALCCQVKFECSGSGSHGKAIYHYFKDMGFSCSFVEGPIDCQRLIDELQKGYPHLMGGKGSDGSHRWIVDGIRISSTGTYFSCNWGEYGQCDGWVEGNPFTAIDSAGKATVYSKNLSHIYIQSIPQK
ncbi:MAG: hypothetical protein HDR88_01890 [Bacteroides sp.]|nr:hypothetical protein [Bacteroides sp.]